MNATVPFCGALWPHFLMVFPHLNMAFVEKC